MAGYRSFSNYMARFNGNPEIVPGGRGGRGGRGSHGLASSSTVELNPIRVIDLDDDAGNGSTLTDFSGLDPYTRMILGYDTAYNGLFDGNPAAVSGRDRNGLMGWIGQSSIVEGETRQHYMAPNFDNYQMPSANASLISSFRSTSAVVGEDNGRAGPSSSGYDQHRSSKREGREDAAGVGVRIGASSDQRNVRQRFSYENQQNLASPTNSNHVRPLSEDPFFVFHFQRSSGNPASSMQDASSSRATAMPAYPPLYDDERLQRMQNSSGAERGYMAQTQTHLSPNYGIDRSNASSSASGSHPEHFHEAYLPIGWGNLVQLTAGPSAGTQYRGETSNHFAPAAAPIQDGINTFGLNRRGEPLTGAALVRRSSNIQAPLLRLLGQDVFVDSLSHQVGSNSAPAHQAASILEPRTQPPTNLAPVSEAAASLAPVTWLPPYLPSLQTAAPGHWLPAYLEPAHQVENNFTPVTWNENDFDEEEEEEEEDDYNNEEMHVDVDNMSYEELLALEDHIGNVSTGLSEDAIKAKLKPKKYSSFTMGSPVEDELCCICQEEYEQGETMGILDCGHEFHFDCIKQWLVQKNLCPICKTAALV